MNAQEAARMVNSGMEKLSLAQLVEVHAVLKGDENSAGRFVWSAVMREASFRFMPAALRIFSPK